jgi:hypothetical protein
VIERARSADPIETPIPSMATVGFVQRATERAAADEETLRTIKKAAFEDGAEAPLLSRKFGELVFPQSDADKREKLRQAIAQVARRLSSLVAEDGAPIPKKVAIRVEETVGELLEAIEN